MVDNSLPIRAESLTEWIANFLRTQLGAEVKVVNINDPYIAEDEVQKIHIGTERASTSM